MVKLSVNVNKVATVRNSRGGANPSPADAARLVIAAGAPGVTVHPRADQRHITPEDVRAISEVVRAHRGIELNIEGDPRPELLALVQEVRPDQCTLVPVKPGEITSQAGWASDAALDPVVRDLQNAGVRVSLFVDPVRDAIHWAADQGADRVELYTEPYARAFERGESDARSSFDVYAAAAEEAHALHLGVNAGHDLDLDNLVLFRELPHLVETSIGHALIGRAIFVGLDRVVREYLEVLRGP